MTNITGYCVKCKKKNVEVGGAKIYETKNGKYMAKGVHEECGTKVCCLMSKDNALGLVQQGVELVKA